MRIVSGFSEISTAVHQKALFVFDKITLQFEPLLRPRKMRTASYVHAIQFIQARSEEFLARPPECEQRSMQFRTRLAPPMRSPSLVVSPL